jgi:hypothetical protein
MYATDMASSGPRIQAILRFCVRNLNGCNITITDGRDL